MLIQMSSEVNPRFWRKIAIETICNACALIVQGIQNLNGIAFGNYSGDVSRNKRHRVA